MSRQQTQNPWRFSCAQVDILDSLCALGHLDSVASALRISRSTVSRHLTAIFEVMGIRGYGAAVIAASRWSAWRATDGKGVPA